MSEILDALEEVLNRWYGPVRAEPAPPGYYDRSGHDPRIDAAEDARDFPDDGGPAWQRWDAYHDRNATGGDPE